MPDIVRTPQMDPMAEKFYDLSPQSFLNNNPLIFIDPTGMQASPIYDENGEFMGTDSEGLKGKAIVMNKSDFKQGMEHKEALSKSLGIEGLKTEEAKTNLSNHYDGLKDRPDYDGQLTLDEANQWARNVEKNDLKGADRNLYVDSGKIDLGTVTKSDFFRSNSIYVNFADPRSDRMVFSTGKVYGTIKLTLLNEQGNLRLGQSNGLLDVYDFNQDGRFLRDQLTKAGKWEATVGNKYKIGSYSIYTYGTATIPNMKK